jgi:hypothetical protein
VVTKGVTERQQGRSVFGAERVIGLVEGFNGVSAAEMCEATLAAAHEFEKLPWYKRHSKDNATVEDLTALVAARPRA